MTLKIQVSNVYIIKTVWRVEYKYSTLILVLILIDIYIFDGVKRIRD